MSSNVRFLLPNQNVGRRHPNLPTRPVLINGNGSYTTPPALIQDPLFPMVNSLLVGRGGTVWHTGGAPSSNFSDSTSVVLELDTVVAQAVTAAGVLGYTCTTSNPNGLEVQYKTGATYGSGTGGWLNAYPAASNLFANGVGQTREVGQTFAPISARYWRFKFNFGGLAANGFGISGVFLQTTVTDLGFLYSGADETRVIGRTVVESYSRQPTIARLGTEYRRWQLRYENNDAAMRTILDNLYSYQGMQEPFIFLTPDDQFYECVWDEESFTRTHIWAPPDRYRMVASIRSLP